jgi:hypothetical protein
MVLTSFLLPSISQVHWITRALWTLSILSAILSILFACKQQRFIGNLFFAGEPGTRKLDRYKASLCEDDPRRKFPIPRLPVVLFLSGSKTFLYYALATYVSGFGVYLGSIWKNDLDVDAGPFDDRNIFIAFLACIIFCLCIYFILDCYSTPDELQQWSNWLGDCKDNKKPPAWDSCCCKIEGNSCPCKRVGAEKADEYTDNRSPRYEEHVSPEMRKVYTV